jgi:hypothetical protein
MVLKEGRREELLSAIKNCLLSRNEKKRKKENRSCVY